MAFPLSLANFLVALQWFVYGYQLKDSFIQVFLTAVVALYFWMMASYCEVFGLHYMVIFNGVTQCYKSEASELCSNLSYSQCYLSYDDVSVKLSV